MTLKFGIIGTNWITESFIEAAKKIDRIELTSVYSRSKAKATAFAEKFGSPKVYTDLEQMAKSKSIDFIYIASPNSLHFEQTILFLQHKKHVICEKPIFSNSTEWETAYNVANQHGVYIFEALRNIHTPNFTTIQENLHEIGKIRSCVFPFVQYSSRYTAYLQGERPNIFTTEFSGGALVDLGVYPIALTVALFGQPEQVHYFPVMLESGVDGAGTLVLTYDGFTSTIISSKIGTSYQACEIHGEEGTIMFESPRDLNAGKLMKAKQEMFLDTKQFENNMQFEIERFVDMIETNDVNAYKTWSQISQTVLSITEQARKSNGIIFPSDQ